jgi:formylglycine-generating enzyme required for sulfatase activity/tRNA A-37 threonylcarbamoyl transferase component Bud32
MKMKHTTINGFTLLRPLGSGGMAEVWYAENRIRKPAAVKVLLKKLMHMDDIVQRFENEAAVMVKLNHPNIRQVWDYGLVDGRPAIVMEYLEGKSLMEAIKNTKGIEDKQAQSWWNQLSDALNYTHAHGVIHRDVSPANTFITSDGQAKLLDFGIAKIIEGIHANLTKTGTRMGNPIYMSPEQVKDSKHLDHRTDLYSLAVTFVHVLGGKSPYDTRLFSDYEINHKIVTEPLDLSGIPKPWQHFLQSYLAKEAASRPVLAHFQNISQNTGETILKTKQAANYTEPLNGVPLEMVFVQGGSFMMGATPEQGDDAADDEKPAHKVSLDSFYIGKYPVTVGQFKQFIDETKYQTDADKGGGSFIYIDENWKEQEGVNWEFDAKGYVRTQHEYHYPVIHVSWNDAAAFSQWLSKKTGKNFRLLSEAEWEYAARGGQKTKRFKFSGSNNLEEVAWYDDNSGSKPHPVGKKQPNELGLYDMSGNVWEWCEDDWHDNYKGAPTDGSAWIDSPRGSGRVFRGGSWLNGSGFCRVSFRYWYYPGGWSYDYGFRLAQDF